MAREYHVSPDVEQMIVTDYPRFTAGRTGGNHRSAVTGIVYKIKLPREEFKCRCGTAVSVGDTAFDCDQDGRQHCCKRCAETR